MHAAGYKNDDTCFLCETAPETHQHLLMNCPKTRKTAEALKIRQMMDLYSNDEDSWQKVKFVTSLLICSWTENKQEAEQMLNTFNASNQPDGRRDNTQDAR